MHLNAFHLHCVYALPNCLGFHLNFKSISTVLWPYKNILVETIFFFCNHKHIYIDTHIHRTQHCKHLLLVSGRTDIIFLLLLFQQVFGWVFGFIFNSVWMLNVGFGFGYGFSFCCVSPGISLFCCLHQSVCLMYGFCMWN